jgi:hypothetical protein
MPIATLGLGVAPGMTRHPFRSCRSDSEGAVPESTERRCSGPCATEPPAQGRVDGGLTRRLPLRLSPPSALLVTRPHERA